MSSQFTSLVSRRVRMRARWCRTKWRVAARLGLCRHPATIGPAGADEGLCVICGKTVPWDE